MSARRKFPSLATVRAWFEANSRRRFKRGCFERCALAAATGFFIGDGTYSLNLEIILKDRGTPLPNWAALFVDAFDGNSFDRTRGSHGTGRECVRLLDEIERALA